MENDDDIIYSISMTTTLPFVCVYFVILFRSATIRGTRIMKIVNATLTDKIVYGRKLVCNIYYII
jgi:hypothetical protein